MPKVVQSNDAHAVGFQDALEAAGKCVGFQPFTQLIHTDVIKVIRAIGASAQPPVVGLFLFLPKQQVTEVRHQRQRPHTGLGLGRIGSNLDVLTVHIAGCHGVPDGDGVGCEVDGVPFQAENLAAAQAVEGT